MKDILSIKIFSSLIIFTAIIFFFSTVGTAIYTSMFEGDLFDEGTMIGPIDISKLSKQDATSKVQQKITQWLSHNSLRIVYGDISQTTSASDIYQFQIDQLVSKAESGKMNPLNATLRKETIKNSIERISKEEYQNFNHEALEREILQHGASLQENPLKLDLVQYITSNNHEMIVKSTISNIADAELIRFTNMLRSAEIPPFQAFSLLDLIHHHELDLLTDEALSIIASAIYETILPTNFQIVERHISDHLPPYAKLGYEAAIVKDHKNLIFYNGNPYMYKLLFSIKDNGFIVELEGKPFLQKYIISLENENSIEPKTVKQYDESLKVGQSKIVEKGEKARSVTVLRRTVDNGGKISEEILSQDYYRPIYRIEHSNIPPLSPNNGPAPDQNGQNNEKDDQLQIPEKRSDSNLSEGNPPDEIEDEDEEFWDIPSIIK